MAQEKLPAIVARIDERTKHIQDDITEVKGTCKCLTETVNKHSEQLAIIIETPNHTGLNRKQTAWIGGASGLLASVIIAVIEYFRH